MADLEKRPDGPHEPKHASGEDPLLAVVGAKDKEGGTPGSQAQLQAATEVVTALAGGLHSYVSSQGRIDPNQPAKSVAQYAQDYARLRAELDAAVADQDSGRIARLAVDAVAAGDELAIRAAVNPTSRIRPAFDRRQSRGAPGATPAGSKLQVEKVGQARFRVGIPYTEAAEHRDGELWALQQRLFHARMDFLSWRIEHDLIAVDDIDVSVELVLSTRTAPRALTTDGQEIKLPDEVEQVHYYVQPEEKWGRGYAHRGYEGDKPQEGGLNW